jgi:hypothetical protein
VRSWRALGFLIFTGALAFWAFDALPFMDLPAHAGLIALRHRFATSPFEQRYYIFDPHIGPYTVFRELAELFTRVIGPLGAVRLLATLPVVATPFAVSYARRRLHGDASPTFPFLALCLCFNLMTLFGFASYLLGVAVLIVTLTSWLLLLADVDARVPTLRREVTVMMLALLLFITHGDAFVTFLPLAAICTLATGDRFRRILRGRALIPAVTFAAYVAWIERASAVPAGSIRSVHDDVGIVFQGVLDKLSLLITPTLMTRTGIDALVGIAIWTMTVLGVVLTVRDARDEHSETPLAQRRHVLALVACMVVTMVAFLGLPHAIRWFGFVDGRLVLVVALLGLMTIRLEALKARPRLLAAFDRMPPFLAATIVLLALGASWRFQREAAGFHAVLANVPAETRLLNLPLDPNSEVFAGHPFVHYDKLVVADRPVLVSDVWLHQGTALFSRPENPAVRLPKSYLEADLKTIVWSDYVLQDWDYVLIRTRPEGTQPYAPPLLTLVSHEGGWWLFRNASAASK